MQNSSPTFLPTTSLIINPPNRGRAHIKGARSHLRLVRQSITFMMMSPTQATQMAHLWIEWGEEENKWSPLDIYWSILQNFGNIYLNRSFKHFYFVFFNANILPIIIFSKKTKQKSQRNFKYTAWWIWIHTHTWAAITHIRTYKGSFYSFPANLLPLRIWGNHTLIPASMDDDSVWHHVLCNFFLFLLLKYDWDSSTLLHE